MQSPANAVVRAEARIERGRCTQVVAGMIRLREPHLSLVLNAHIYTRIICKRIRLDFRTRAIVRRDDEGGEGLDENCY